MSNDNVLSEKERSLIAVGASVAAGCQPCAAHLIKAADAAGACNRGISLAIETAIAGRDSATELMHEWAKQCQGSQPEIDPEFRAQKRLIVELTAVATAVAVNSVPDLTRHLAAAQECGASDGQIRSAIEIARYIKRVAEEKVEVLTSKLAAVVPPAMAPSAGSGCQSSEPVQAREAAVETRTDCGCH
jgi:AhpD family alkylhydroperoxidase